MTNKPSITLIDVGICLWFVMALASIAIWLYVLCYFIDLTMKLW